jgi:predicted N-acyltransferase
MEMDIPGEWHVMADYEKALKHKYAQRMRKVRAELAKLNIKELDEEGVKSNKVVLFGLYQQVVARQQVRLGLLNEDFLPVLKRFHGDDLRVWLAYENEKPVGFFSAWVKEGVFDMFYIGFDYARNQELQLYFNMLFFGVEQAITNGKEKLILGRTALDAKARIGCKPRYLSTYLYIKNSFLRQRVLNLQQKTALQEGAWEDRHPFKS